MAAKKAVAKKVAKKVTKRGTKKPNNGRRYSQAFRAKCIEDAIKTVSCGGTLTSVIEPHGISRTTFHSWIAGQGAVERFARAREDGEWALAEQCLEIADTPREGVITRDTPDGVIVTTEDMLGHRKLQVETRLKLLAKFNPKRWGERVAVDHGVQDSLAEKLRLARERSGK